MRREPRIAAAPVALAGADMHFSISVLAVPVDDGRGQTSIYPFERKL